MTRSPFLHERLDAYHHALNFYRVARELRKGLPRGLGDLGDELFRAAGSICRNLAEGCASYGKDQKRRYFRIALGSAGECACILDQILVEEAADTDTVGRARSHLEAATITTIGLVS